VVAAGTPAELMTSGGGEIRFGAPRGLDTSALGADLGAPVVEASPGEYVVGAPPSPTTVAALTTWLARHDVALADLRAGRQSLEDVFLRLTTAAEPAGTEAGARRARRRSRR
jgi:ABC-2 type transport system ATP-binding protein